MKYRQVMVFASVCWTACGIAAHAEPRLADAQALPAVRALYAELSALPQRADQRVLSGQFMGWFPVCSLATANEIYQQTSNWVAVAGFDYYETFVNTPKTKPDRFKPPRWRYINELVKTHVALGGVATLSLHMTNPWTGGLAWDKTGNLADLLDPSSAAYPAYRQQLDEVARGLADLQAAQVVVLFRPFHEMTGAFWWGGKESETFKKLWIELFRYYTQEKQLHNLIWVWSPLVSSTAMRYYPGDAYVDMTGLDIYASNLGSAKTVYAEIVKTGKPFAITEFGPPGNALDNTSPRNYDYGTFARQIREVMPDTVYFLAWRDAWGLHRNLNAKQLLSDPWVRNRDKK